MNPKKGLSLYFISFSEQEDDLTMWRGYGQNGDGISLGFDFDKLPGAPLMRLREIEIILKITIIN